MLHSYPMHVVRSSNNQYEVVMFCHSPDGLEWRWYLPSSHSPGMRLGQPASSHCRSSDTVGKASKVPLMQPRFLRLILPLVCRTHFSFPSSLAVASKTHRPDETNRRSWRKYK